MNNYDHDVLGVGNSQHPANQKEVEAEPIREFKTLSDAYVNGDTEEFANFQEQLLEEANFLLYALESVESGLTGKLKSIINKLQ